jgi:predicted metalloprotease with PDZ domain
LIDQQIQDKSGGKLGLDDLMREMLLEFRGDKSLKFTHGLWKSYLIKYLGTESLGEFNTYIESGNPIDFSAITYLKYPFDGTKFSINP